MRSSPSRSLNAQTRREWIAALDTIESLNPRAVIAGHKWPGKDDSPKIIEETRAVHPRFRPPGRDDDDRARALRQDAELYPERVNRYPSGFRRMRPSRKLFRTKGVFLCGSCNS
jgi:hypothetical protein